MSWAGHELSGDGKRAVVSCANRADRRTGPPQAVGGVDAGHGACAHAIPPRYPVMGAPYRATTATPSDLSDAELNTLCDQLMAGLDADLPELDAAPEVPLVVEFANASLDCSPWGPPPLSADKWATLNVVMELAQEAVAGVLARRCGVGTLWRGTGAAVGGEPFPVPECRHRADHQPVAVALVAETLKIETPELLDGDDSYEQLGFGQITPKSPEPKSGVSEASPMPPPPWRGRSPQRADRGAARPYSGSWVFPPWTAGTPPRLGL